MLRAARDALAMSSGPFKDYAHQLLFSLTGEMDGASAARGIKWWMAFLASQISTGHAVLRVKIEYPKMVVDGQSKRPDEISAVCRAPKKRNHPCKRDRP